VTNERQHEEHGARQIPRTEGRAKEYFGKVVNSPKIALEGRAEKIAGKAEENLGQIKKSVGR
jgi:uncharacterized protein YjbJ (UPF0337 family)